MLGRPAREQQLWTQSVPGPATITSANKAPKALNDYGFPNSSGSLAIFAAIRRAYPIPEFFVSCSSVCAGRKVMRRCSYDRLVQYSPKLMGAVVPCRSALQKKANVGAKPCPRWESPACLSHWQAERRHQLAERWMHRRRHSLMRSFSVRRKSSIPACRHFSRSTEKMPDKPRSPNR